MILEKPLIKKEKFNFKNNLYQFKFVDLFAGIGGFHQGLKELGGRCVAACEIDEAARKTYLSNYSVPKDFFYRDIHDIDVSLFPSHDFLCAGFPCQPFSISGKQKGLNDIRSNTINPLFSIIKAKMPKIVMLENVKHVKYIDKGRTFALITKNLKSFGYSVSHMLLNAKDYGVAQNRERCLFVATLSKSSFSLKPSFFNKTYIKDILEKQSDFQYLKEPFTLIDNPKKQKSGLIFSAYINKKIRKIGIRENTHHLSRVHKQPNRIYSIYGLHPTIPSQETSGRFWVLLDNNKVRKLTIKECFRLMGFKDNFIKPVSKGSLYKQIGNSVCVPMIKSVAQSILNHMAFFK